MSHPSQLSAPPAPLKTPASSVSIFLRNRTQAGWREVISRLRPLRSGNDWGGVGVSMEPTADRPPIPGGPASLGRKVLHGDHLAGR